LNNINSLSVCFFLGAKRRSNPPFFAAVDCFAALAMTVLPSFFCPPADKE